MRDFLSAWVICLASFVPLFAQQASVSSPDMALVFSEGSVSSTMAREMLDALDEEYARIRHELQCVIGSKITTIVMPLAQWEAAGHSPWAGALFDGRIQVPLVYENSRVGPRMRRVFAHEVVHACISRFGPFPTWLHEGLAQYLSGDRLNQDQKRALRQALSANRLPPLEQIAGPWGGLQAAQATTAYAYALWALEAAIDSEGLETFRQILRYPDRLPALTTKINALLRQ
jgi:uncharacterized membrane protein